MRLTKSIVVTTVMAVAMIGYAGDSSPFRLDTRTGVRKSTGEEVLTYSSLWDGDADANVTIAQDGVVLAEGLTGEGEQAWNVHKAGTYTLTHTTFTNGVAGKVETATFKFTKDIASLTVGDISNMTYTGSPLTPNPVVTDPASGYTLVKGTDYRLTYANNTDAGEATVSVAGKGNYTGSVLKTFIITKAENEWITEPTIAGWTYGQPANEPDMGEAKFGTVAVSYGELGASRPAGAGNYVATFTVAETANYTGLTKEVPFAIASAEEEKLKEAFEGLPVTIIPDDGGGWKVMVTNDIDMTDGALEIPDNIGPVTIDLGGHDLAGMNGKDGGTSGESALPGEDGQPAIRVVPGEGGGEPTVLTVVSTGGDAVVKGGDGGAGNPGGNGAPAIEVADGAQDGVSISIGEGVTVRGGDGGASDAGHGGDGGAGIVGNVGTNDGTIIGGNGGGSSAGDGGNGGVGVDGNVDVNNGTISGGEGGASETGDDGNPGAGVTGDVGTNNGSIVVPEVKADFTLKAGEYFKMTLAELGYDVPTDGTPYSVVAKGLPAGLKLKYNAAWKNKKGKVVVKAKSEWWIEGVPTAALDYATNPAYLVITANGETKTLPLSLGVKAQKVTDLGELALRHSMKEQFYLPGVTNGWTVSGLPTGLKYTAKALTEKLKSGKKTLVVTNALPYSVYGKTTKAGLFTITAKKKNGAFYETMKYRVLVTPAVATSATFPGGESLTNITTMAYVPIAWDLTGEDGRGGSPSRPQSGDGGEQSSVDGGAVATTSFAKATAVKCATLPSVGKVAKVTGLPTGLTFAAVDTYSDKKKKNLKQRGQTIVGTPTKPGTYVATFTKNVKSGKKTVAKTAQILWTVTANDAELALDFNTAGGVVESGTVGLNYGDLLAFTATEGAKVTASGLPAGLKLVRLESGALGESALPSRVAWGFEGFTTKAGTYLVTVKATVNGNVVTQRVALKADGLPAWAKGTYNGVVRGMGNGERGMGNTNGLATVTVSSAGKISGKFRELGTNWTFSAACYTAATTSFAKATAVKCAALPKTQQAGGSSSSTTETTDTFICSNVVAKYSWKVKSGKKTVTKTVTRAFTLTVDERRVEDPTFAEGYGGASIAPYHGEGTRGFATLTEAGGSQFTATGEGADAINCVPPVAAEIEAWQNLWGSTYKALGKKLFTTKSGKKTLAYKTFTFNVYTNAAGQISFIAKDDGESTYFAAMSLKVTTAGAVTATMTYDTGKTAKDKKTKKTVKVYYKPTCATVLVPTSAPDADEFTGYVPVYFAPSPGNNFPGCAVPVPLQL